MTKLDWDRVRRERSLFADFADLRAEGKGSSWRGYGPPLKAPTSPGVVRWAVTGDSSRVAVQWCAEGAEAPVRIDYECAIAVLKRLDEEGRLRPHGPSMIADVRPFSIWPAPRGTYGPGELRWWVKFDDEERAWICTAEASMPLDALVWRFASEATEAGS